MGKPDLPDRAQRHSGQRMTATDSGNQQLPRLAVPDRSRISGWILFLVGEITDPETRKD